MIKKLSVLALVGCLATPLAAFAASNADLEERISDLESQIEDKGESWDLASRINMYGDIRSRYDWYDRDRKNYDSLGNRATLSDHSSSMWTTRLRLNMRAKATENVEVKVRLAMYKAWGMQHVPSDNTGTFGGFPAFDGTSTRQPADNALRVDRAFMNWNNIGGMPMWFSIGRRPTTDGPPAHLRMGRDKRMATPVNYMDWPFDGISMGYAYALPGDMDGSGRVRVCYGRGFENGVNQDNSGINDTDFIGVSWDVFKMGNRFMNLQSFLAYGIFNYPDFTDSAMNTAYNTSMNGRKNIGSIYHTSGVYLDKIADLNYFVTGGWSRTDPNAQGMFNDVLNGTTNYNTQNGWSAYVGVRYDIEDLGLKVGAEYNHGSQYWIAMTPGHDDMYSSKLATRGNAYELYTIYDLPSGDTISKYGAAFLRLGFIYYDFDYTGGMDWNYKPYDIDSAKANQIGAAGAFAVEKATQVYATIEAYF